MTTGPSLISIDNYTTAVCKIGIGTRLSNVCHDKSDYPLLEVQEQQTSAGRLNGLPVKAAGELKTARVLIRHDDFTVTISDWRSPPEAAILFRYGLLHAPQGG